MCSGPAHWVIPIENPTRVKFIKGEWFWAWEQRGNGYDTGPVPSNIQTQIYLLGGLCSEPGNEEGTVSPIEHPNKAIYIKEEWFWAWERRGNGYDTGPVSSNIQTKFTRKRTLSAQTFLHRNSIFNLSR